MPLWGCCDRRNVAVEQVYAPLDRSRHHDLFLLAETLLEYDELFNLWRTHHRAMVERALREPPKAPATPPAYATSDRTLTYPHFFPELWEARATLWQQMSERQASDEE